MHSNKPFVQMQHALQTIHGHTQAIDVDVYGFVVPTKFQATFCAF